VSILEGALGATRAGGFSVRRPLLFEARPLDPASILGALFSPSTPGVEAQDDATALLAPVQRRLGELSPALMLLPPRERERATVLGVWADALFVTAVEGDRPEKRLERLNRSAFLLARALAGERVEAPFAERFAAESARRPFGRRALDLLLAASRETVRSPLTRIDPSSPRWCERSRQVAGAIAEALLGLEPTAATVDAAQGILRLLRLAAAPPAGDGSGSASDRAGRAALIAAESEAIHPLLLRGARAVGEVPLTFRRALAGLLTLGLQLLGEIESHPERLLAKAPRLGRFGRAWTLYRIRRDKLV